MNWTIDFGQILTVVVMIAAVVGAHYSLKGSLGVFGARLDALEIRFSETMTRLGKHEDAITKVTSDLQRVIGSLDRRAS